MPTPSQAGAAPPAGPSLTFRTACFVLVALLSALYVWLARQEFFFGDDLVFLHRAQMPRDWAEVFVSFEPRGWWSYRPLSIEVFFSSLYAIAGLEPFPYLLVSVIVHLATGLLLFRVALRLGIDRRVAMIAGLLKIAMYPTLNGELFWISAFQTVLGSFFYLLTVSLFLDYLTHGRRRDQVAAGAAMVLALLSNELAMTLPGPIVLFALIHASGTLRERIVGTLRASAPLIAILAVYLPFRYWLLWPTFLPTPGLNVPHLGTHIFWNVRNFLRILAKHSAVLQVALLTIVALGGIAAARIGDGAPTTLLRRWAMLGGWLLCAMVPYLGTYFLHHRAAIVLEAPFCLLIAAHLDPIVRAARTLRAVRLVEAAMLALVVIAFPYDAVGEQARAPRGKVNRDLLAILASEPSFPEGACARIHLAEGSEPRSIDLFSLRFNTTGLMNVFHPGRHLEIPPEPGKTRVLRKRCTALVEMEIDPRGDGQRQTFELRRVQRAAG